MPSERKWRRKERRDRMPMSDDPRDGHPLRLGVEFTGDGQQLIEGRRQVAIDDNIIKQMAVMEFDPLTTTNHFGQFVIGETARWILVESATRVRRRTGFTKDGKTGRFDVNHVWFKFTRSQRFQSLQSRTSHPKVIFNVDSWANVRKWFSILSYLMMRIEDASVA